MSSINPAPATEPSAAPPDLLEDALFQIKRVIVGQDRMVERALVCLLARGHCLHRRRARRGQDARRVDHGPASSAARSAACSSPPTWCRPTSSAPASGARHGRTFDIEWGPIFANIVLADEINRAPGQGAVGAARGHGRGPRVDRRRRPARCPTPFLVLATQNPIESEGVYTLAEAQRDRFLMQIDVKHPTLRRGDRDRPPHGRAAADGRAGADVGAAARPAGRWPTTCSCTTPWPTTRCASSWPPATRRRGACPTSPRTSPWAPAPAPRSA